jgi:hypothetical protein
VNGRALYAAIGEADSHLRKPVTHAIQRLMVIDALVEGVTESRDGLLQRQKTKHSGKATGSDGAFMFMQGR